MTAPSAADPGALLARDPAWRPSPDEAAPWRARAAAPGAPPALLQEIRWWRAWEAGRAGDWGAVSALADEGLAEPFSEREAFRLALLHCLSGAVEEAEHVVAQAVQTVADESFPRRVAEACAREGLVEAARRLEGRG
jgi:hypothetical protein